jgi:hypothetical protein
MNAQIQFIAPTEIAVTLKGQETDRRQAVHLIFLIDTSDSMSDSNKLRSVKRSLEFIQPLLTPEDLVSMINFGETSQILLNKSPATDADSILYKINALRTDGCTNMSAGLMNVRDVLLPADDTRKQGVLLLTDGHANRGISDSAGLKTIVQNLLTERPTLTITTVGYGNDHNADMLKEIGTTGAGSYNVVYNLENVATVFGEVLGGLTTVVAQNVTVHLPPGSVPKTAYATTTEQDGTVQVRIGDIYAENEVVVLATLPEGADTVRVTGHNMLNLTAQDERLTAEPMAAGGSVPKHLEQAVFRYRVCEVLKRTLDHNANRTTLKSDVEDLLRQLKDLPYAAEQLIQMMIDDLESVLISFETYGGGAPLGATATNLAQHSAYLGLGRGLRSLAPADDEDPHVHYGGGGGAGLAAVATGGVMLGATSSAPWAAAGDPVEGAAPGGGGLAATRSAAVDANFSPFSNRRQRNVTTSLRATSSAAP